MKTVNTIIERSAEGGYSLYMKDADFLSYGITCTGSTEAEAIATFYDLYDGMRALYKEEKKQFEEVAFVFRCDVVSYLQYYAKTFTLVALERITGINQGQLSHYINETSKPSKKTAEKIISSLRKFFAQENATFSV